MCILYFELLSKNETVHSLVGSKFENVDSIRSNVEKYLNEKPKKFYSDGIIVLLKSWK
ncbi:hypothetical protein WH47_10482 [Habropoda laboriosa]|uniref:Histone-lysine N-methyltransferase SETMAR n=1 Tax=Habropoda laboriosa TaxID=597456 RepID=A0A0L7QMR2_9HYME|nr:hypothetical protein WH47_10482 [Habropoda laboriosa]